MQGICNLGAMANLSVIKASAGSGKTYRLAYEYVKLVIREPKNYKHILAVTFTNKATAEMKERVLKELYALSIGTETNYMFDLTKDLDTDKKEVISKAKKAIYYILHNYSRFTIETIDSFFQRIIRSFSREMGLNTGIQIELNTDNILENSVDLLLDDLSQNANLRQWMRDFVTGKMEEGKNWKVRNEITKLGKEIYQETFQTRGEQIYKNVSDHHFMNEYRKQLFAIRQNYLNRLQDLGKQAIDKMLEHGYTIDDFSSKKNGIAGFLNGLKNGTKLQTTPTFDNILADYTKAVTKSNPNFSELTSFVETHWLPILNTFYQTYTSQFIVYQTAELVLQNLFTLGLIVDIQKYANEYTRNEDLFAIGDSGIFLQKIIGDNDTPFIYEKTGNYFNHYMIDEFQDTSVIQYENFKPLIDNSLSYGNYNLLVGDVKQAIYRFRNTNWEVLAYKVKKDFTTNVKEETLMSNWRSDWEVVNFNNKVFQQIPGYLQNEFDQELAKSLLDDPSKKIFEDIIADIYAEAGQKCEKKDKKGYVRFSVFDNEEKSSYLELLLEQVCELQDAGLKAGDMAILTRTNTQARDIVNFFMEMREKKPEYNLNITSAEALFLTSSSSVNLLLASFTYLLDPENKLNAYYIFHQLRNMELLESTENESENYPNTLAIYLLPITKKYRQWSLYELGTAFIDHYGLNHYKEEINYLYAFLDVMLEFQNRNGSDLQRFIDYWEQEGNKKTVPPTNGQNAIEVITVHKSKGLEFKVVIIPQCDWNLDHDAVKTNFLWCEPTTEPFNQIELVPVKYQSKMAQSYFAGEYFAEKLKAYVDNLNLLYVALTRAKKVLIVNTPSVKKKKDKIGSVGRLLELALNNSGTEAEIQNENLTTWSFGHLEGIPEENSVAIPVIEPEWIRSNDIGGRVKMALKGKEYFNEITFEQEQHRRHGTVLHEIFSRIKTSEQIATVLKQASIEGLITGDEADSLAKRIHNKITDNDLLKHWFSENVKVYSEKDIFIPGGKKIRPDRIIHTSNELVILDFKFGTTKAPDDVLQVRTYMKQLEEMNISNSKVKGYLWYFYLNHLDEIGHDSNIENQQTSLW